MTTPFLLFTYSCRQKCVKVSTVSLTDNPELHCLKPLRIFLHFWAYSSQLRLPRLLMLLFLVQSLFLDSRIEPRSRSLLGCWNVGLSLGARPLGGSLSWILP